MTSSFKFSLGKPDGWSEYSKSAVKLSRENSLIIFKNVTNTQHVYFEMGVYIEKNDVPKSVSDNTQLN